jgi:sigma-E factor negative regulatory protein RseB
MSARARLARWLALLCVSGVLGPAFAQAGGPGQGDGSPPLDDARAWLTRMQQAASDRNYQGTMVFSAGGVSSSSRVAHFHVGDQVYERVETLDGKQRQVYRHNEWVHTVWPQESLMVIERRSQKTSLPAVMQAVEPRALDRYALRPEGQQRMAGRKAWTFLLQPRDDLRYPQRIWVDAETGLMLGVNVVDVGARTVLESTVFSDVEIGMRPKPESVLKPFGHLDGLRVQRPVQQPTRLETQGWTLAQPPDGFLLNDCTLSLPLGGPDGAAPAEAAKRGLTQAVFSDGLTHVSMFIESFDPQRHHQEIGARFGATYALTKRRGEHWVTLMGDVPAATLQRFADALKPSP